MVRRPVTGMVAAGCLLLSVSNVAHADPAEPPRASNWGWPPGAQMAAQDGDGAAAQALTLGAQMAENAVGEALGGALGSVPPWLQRVELGLSFSSDFDAEFFLSTVQPLWRSAGARDTVFFQGRVASGEDELTTNLGLGYRRLVWDRRLMLGANAFLDKEWDDDHNRAGVGVEARSMPFDLIANYYEALSGRHRVDSDTYERALDGFDVELGVQVPHLPWAKVFARKSWWDGVEAADVQSERVAVRLRPVPHIEVEAGRQWTDRQSSESFLKLSVNLRLGPNVPGVGSADGLVSGQPFLFADMTHATLEAVRRQNSIVVERTSTGATGSVVVARAN